MAITSGFSKTITAQLNIANGQYLVVSHFNEDWLVVGSGLKTMEVRHNGGNVGKPGV